MRMKAEEPKEHFEVFSQILEVKRCMKCGRKLPEDSKARRCPCGGSLKTIYRPVANRVKRE